MRCPACNHELAPTMIPGSCETSKNGCHVLDERVKRVADAIIAIGEGRSKLAPMERLSERQAEERHRMAQAQRLK